jgi:aminomethyltransferase
VASVPETEIRRTPLYDVHVSLGARMVPFAGFAMPVQYPAGIIAEHNATRSAAGLFDVSHMGQAILRGDDPAASFERLVPGDITGLTTGRMRYTLLLNDAGGIRDDLMVTQIEEGGLPALFLVVNAGCKDADFAHIAALLADEAELQILNDSALLALQGPKAEAVLATLAPECRYLVFKQGAEMTLDGAAAYVTRSGYTGEDGFEISLANDAVAGLAQTLLAHDDVEPVGLGARDSLRLEAGLCLYGHDIDETTSPIEAGLAWAVGKRRRESADFPGAETILQQLNEGPARKRVGIRPDGRAPVREGAVIRDAEDAEIGIVTSGGFGPTVGGPVAMGYVNAACAASGTALKIELRGRSVPATVADLPFVPAKYKRAR